MSIIKAAVAIYSNKVYLKPNPTPTESTDIATNIPNNDPKPGNPARRSLKQPVYESYSVREQGILNANEA